MPTDAVPYTVVRQYVAPVANLVTDPAGVLKAAQAALVRKAGAEGCRIDLADVAVSCRRLMRSGGVDCAMLWLEAPAIGKRRI